MTRPPVPTFTEETAWQVVLGAEDAWSFRARPESEAGTAFPPE